MNLRINPWKGKKSPSMKKKQRKMSMNETKHFFTDEEQLRLREVNELYEIYSVHLRRRVGYIAEAHGFDPTKNNISFNLKDMSYTVEPIKEEEKTDKK